MNSFPAIYSYALGSNPLARRALMALFILILLVGCSGGPTKIVVPSFDPADAASEAMATYDTDGDGFVAGEELEKAPGLNGARKNFDTDGDGKISEEEVFNRVSLWNEMGIGLMKFSCEVTLDGRPLEGATVTFVPEEFLGGVTQEASDTTNMVGTATPLIPLEKQAAPDNPPGIQAGLYKVQISKKQGEQELIPAKYNSDTILGQEVSRADPAIADHAVRFDVKSK